MKYGVVRVLALAALVGLAAPSAVGAAAAPSPSDRQAAIDAEARRLRQQLGEAADQEAERIAELNVTRRERAALDGRVAELDRSIVAAQGEQARVDAELGAAVVAEQAAEAAVEEAKRELREARQRLRRQAVEAYIGFGGRPSADHLLATLEDVNDAPRVAAYVDAIARRQARVVNRLRRVQRDTAALEDEARDAKSDVAARQQEANDRRVALEAARAEQAAARAEVATQAANEQRLLADVQSRRREYQRQLDQLQRESNDIATQLRRRQSGQPVTPSGSGVLAYPVSNPVITSTFGYRVHPIYGDRRLHAGIDLKAAEGTPVRSAGDGTVVFAGWKNGYGNTVVIDHGGQLATLYGHNSGLSVDTGDAVKRGQLIASAGSTGNSTGPHVHFEVRVSGTPVDPMRYL